MSRAAAFLGKLLLAAASVLGVFLVVLVGLGVYLVALPLRHRGLAPRYALGRAVVDVLVALNVLVDAAKAAKVDVPPPGEFAENSPTPPHTSAH